MNLSKERSLDSLGLTRGFHASISELTKCLGYNGKLKDLSSLAFPDPSQYTSEDDLEAFWADYQLYNIVRKSDPLNLTQDQKDVLRRKTFQKWMETERANVVANSKFALGPLMNHGKWTNTIVRAQEYVASVLGSFDRQKIDDLQDHFAFTSGATTTHKRKRGDTIYKITEPLGVTDKVSDLALVVMWTDPNWKQIMCDTISEWPGVWLTPQVGACWDAVNKTADILRPIAIQPTGNQLIQSSLGRTMRALFKMHAKIDLSTSWILNKDLACESSGRDHGQNATVDGESASALYSYRLVEILLHLCPGWLNVLDKARCELIKVPTIDAIEYGVRFFELHDGEYYRRSTGFMDMGVGFCFELQSIFFWALAKALCDKSPIMSHDSSNITIFGDDLVIPSSAFAEWCEFATYLNFKVNHTKSFSGNDILFRESCGGHYFNFTDVTPILRKEQSGQSVVDWLWLLNTVRLKEMYWNKKSVRRWYAKWFEQINSSFPIARSTCVPPSYGLVAGWVQPEPAFAPRNKFLRTNYFTVCALTTVDQSHEHNGHSALHAHLFGGKLLPSQPRPWDTNTLENAYLLSNNVLIEELPLPWRFRLNARRNPAFADHRQAKVFLRDVFVTHLLEFAERNVCQGYRRAISKGKVIQQSWNQGWWD
jgi:hypothetical protein